MSRAALLAAVLAANAAAAQTFYEYLPFKNLSDSQTRFQYYVDDREAMPANVSVASVKAAADAAWSQWNLSCAVPKSQSMGFTTGAVSQPSNPYDAFNVTPVFVTTMSDPYYANAFGYDLSAVTLPLQYAGVLQQCDIYLNGATRTWSTSATPASNAMDVETVMLHEVGHCLGIDHNPYYPMSVMVASVLPGTLKRALTTDDADMLCQRYPAVGGVGSPCPDGGGCGSGALKCVTQPGSTPTLRFCTKGCPTGQNYMCELPLTCQASTTFNPSFDGACLRPGANVTLVGKACSTNPECSSSLGSCRLPKTNTSTGTTLWVDGYCTQSCAPGQPSCPAGSACITVNLPAPEGPTDMCLQSCRVGFADCRPGYGCAATAAGGVCAPRCESNGDCGSGFACRTCDGLCVPINSQTQPGDVCTTDDTCGFGQTCIPLDRRGTRLCSSGCGSGCQTCPPGSSCHPIELLGGQLFCLRNCVSGTCPIPLQCANLPTGRGCLPPCFVDSECPVGTTCNGGECNNPMVDPDGGCGLLCTTEDGGVPIKPPRKDAGAGPGGSGGCGCNSSPASLLFALMGLLLPRGRLWRRRQ